MYIYLCSKVLSGKKIFNGINERDFFIQETGSPGYFGKQRKYSRGIFYRRYTPLLHTGVDAECTRVFYLQLQPWFSLPAALPEPANDRISLTYPVVGRLSLSLSPPLRLLRSFLFRRPTSALPTHLSLIRCTGKLT